MAFLQTVVGYLDDFDDDDDIFMHDFVCSKFRYIFNIKM
jgi:hypothetical protein